MTAVDNDLPPERALLALLLPMLTGSGGSARSPAADDWIPTLSTPLTETAPQPAGPPTNLPPASRNPPSPAQMGRDRIAQIKSTLLEFIGPMADLLVDKQLAAGVGDLDTLVERLAEQIGSARDAQAFRDRIRKLQG